MKKRLIVELVSMVLSLALWLVVAWIIVQTIPKLDLKQPLNLMVALANLTVLIRIPTAVHEMVNTVAYTERQSA